MYVRITKLFLKNVVLNALRFNVSVSDFFPAFFTKTLTEVKGRLIYPRLRDLDDYNLTTQTYKTK